MNTSRSKYRRAIRLLCQPTPIPGNERLIANTINNLFLRGANVIYGRDAGVHVSGHACREEQKLMINICRPKFFVPVHGEYRMLVKHAQLATECGVPAENTFVMENGEVLELFKDKGQTIGRIKSGIVLIDSVGSWEIDAQTIEERMALSEEGVVNIAVTLSSDKEVLAGPDVSIRGLLLPREVPPEDFLLQLKADVTEIVNNERQQLQTLSATDLRNSLLGAVNKHFSEVLKMHPLIQLLVQEIQLPGDPIVTHKTLREASKPPGTSLTGPDRRLIRRLAILPKIDHVIQQAPHLPLCEPGHRRMIIYGQAQHGNLTGLPGAVSVSFVNLQSILAIIYLSINLSLPFLQYLHDCLLRRILIPCGFRNIAGVNAPVQFF